MNPKKNKSMIPSSYAHKAKIIPRSAHIVSRANISDHALKVLRRFQQAEIEAYLVGGGVRDLLLHHSPKDFDVATVAHPEAVRKLFRNCRLIGRRFRLAHIYFGRDIIEVATFRAKNAPKHHKHHRLNEQRPTENIYGTLEEDAWRRDITINALYYYLGDFSIIDFTGGFEDLQNKLIRIIGDPQERYEEDPVRLLRVIRFAAKLDFKIESKTAAPLKKSAPLLASVPPARLFEEIIKLFLSGQGLAVYDLLIYHTLFTALFPLVQFKEEKMDTFIRILLKNTDERVSSGKTVTPAFFFAAFLWHPFLNKTQSLEKEGLSPLLAFEEAMQTILVEQSEISAIPKRLRILIREIWFLQIRFTKRYGGKAFQLQAHPRFRAAYDFFLLRAESKEIDNDLAAWWDTFQIATPEQQEEMVAKIPKPRPRKKQN